MVWLDVGSDAEFTAVPATMAYPVPSIVKTGVAAALLLQGIFSVSLVHKTVHVKKGDWILVHAAAGGVGLWLCQLLKSIGAKKIGTASTAEQMKLAMENGANYMLSYKEESDLVEKCPRLRGDRG